MQPKFPLQTRWSVNENSIITGQGGPLLAKERTSDVHRRTSFHYYIADLTRGHSCRSEVIFFGEAALRPTLSNCVLHFHSERSHQAKGDVIVAPEPVRSNREIVCQDRLSRTSGRAAEILLPWHRMSVLRRWEM